MAKPTSYAPSAAAFAPHPENPLLGIPLVHAVAADGMPTTGGAHAYGYTAGLLTTDTWTVGGAVYVKTYAYTNGALSSESDWVKQ